MLKMIAGGLVVSALCCSSAFAAGGQLPALKVKSEKEIPPSSRAMLSGTCSGDSCKVMAKGVKKASGKAYGFTTGVAKDKGSFKLGVLLADLEVSLNGADRQKAVAAATTLAEGLKSLGAQASMIQSVGNLAIALSSGADMKTTSKVSIQLLKPFIDEFVAKEGQTDYLRLGEWVESSRLILQASKGNIGVEFLNGENWAAYFATALKDKNLPQGAVDALMALAEMEKNPATAKDVKAALSKLNNIIEIMG